MGAQREASDTPHPEVASRGGYRGVDRLSSGPEHPDPDDLGSIVFNRPATIYTNGKVSSQPFVQCRFSSSNVVSSTTGSNLRGRISIDPSRDQSTDD